MTGGSLGSRAADRGKAWVQAVRKAAAVGSGLGGRCGAGAVSAEAVTVSLSEHWQLEVLASGSRPHRRRQAGP